MSVFSQGINQYRLQRLDNRIIDLNNALHMHTGNTHGLEQCILSEVWPKTFPYVAMELQLGVFGFMPTTHGNKRKQNAFTIFARHATFQYASDE